MVGMEATMTINWERVWGTYYVAVVDGVTFRVQRINTDIEADRPRWVFDAHEGAERLLPSVEIGTERTGRVYAMRRATALAQRAIPILFA